MLVTIETNGETFTADSIAEAKRIERKAKRAETAKAAKDSADAETAYLYARANAWNLLERHLKDEAFPRGWRFHLPGSTYSPCRLDPISDVSWHRKTYSVDCEHGRGLFNLWSDRERLVGTIENGAGFTMAIIIERLQDDQTWREECRAVGVAGDQVRFADAPTITKTVFIAGE